MKQRVVRGVFGLVRSAVRARRALRGPLRPTWEEGFETWATMIHLYGLQQHRLSLSAQRQALKGFLSPRPPAGIRYEKVDASGVPAEWFIPDGADGARALVYLHGGGYCLGSIDTHRDPITRLAIAARARTLVVDYRLAPEHPFPAQLNDARTAYAWLVASGVSPSRIVVAGESAGAGLTLSLLVALRDTRAAALPAAAVCMSPWVDLEVTGGTIVQNARYDYVTRDSLHLCAERLAPPSLTDPLVSALHADLRGLPQLLVVAGGAETLLDDARRLADRAGAHGVPVTLEVEPDMIHAWTLFAASFPRCQASLERIAAFVRERLADHPAAEAPRAPAA